MPVNGDSLDISSLRIFHHDYWVDAANLAQGNQNLWSMKMRMQIAQALETYKRECMLKTLEEFDDHAANDYFTL